MRLGWGGGGGGGGVGGREKEGREKVWFGEGGFVLKALPV